MNEILDGKLLPEDPKRRVEFPNINKYTRLWRDVYEADDDVVDLEALDAALSAGEITEEQYFKLNRRISERDSLIKQGLSDAAKTLGNKVEKLGIDPVT